MTTRASARCLLLAGLALLPGCSDSADPRPTGVGAAAALGGVATAGAAVGGAASGGVGATASGGAGATSPHAGSAALGGGGQSVGGATGGQSGTAAGGASEGAGGAGGLPPLEECSGTPSVDRLMQWVASGEGLTEPKTGTILIPEGEKYVAKVRFVGAEWHVVPVYLANEFGDTADLSASQGVTLTYSATAELHVQLRSETNWSGGDQYATTIPATNGQKQTRFFSFESANWQSLFGAPELSWADTLKQGMGLVFVGNRDNEVVFYGLRVDGWTPPCP